MPLTPSEYAEIQAYREIKDAPVCPDCRRALLEEILHKTCSECGAKFKDPEVKAALEHGR